jgi:hypothetical protein
MRSGGRLFFLAVLIGVGLALSRGHLGRAPLSGQAPSQPAATSRPLSTARASRSHDASVAVPDVPRAERVSAWIRARSFQLTGSEPAPLLIASGPDGTAMWMRDALGRGTLQAGVHGNGFPFLLVSDGAVRTFGLGRVDGRNASPILVLRGDDVVKLVMGLSMTESGQPAFLVHWGADGQMNLPLGRYCNNPNRVCTE